MNDYEIGDSVELLLPYRGYRYATVVNFDGNKIIIQLDSGLEISVYADELKEG